MSLGKTSSFFELCFGCLVLELSMPAAKGNMSSIPSTSCVGGVSGAACNHEQRIRMSVSQATHHHFGLKNTGVISILWNIVKVATNGHQSFNPLGVRGTRGIATCFLILGQNSLLKDNLHHRASEYAKIVEEGVWGRSVEGRVGLIMSGSCGLISIILVLALVLILSLLLGGRSMSMSEEEGLGIIVKHVRSTMRG